MDNTNRFEVEDFLGTSNVPKKEVLRDFSRKKDSEIIFQAKFTAADQNGNMAYFVREGNTTYKIVMLAEDRVGGVVGGDNKKNSRQRLSLDRPFPVMVKSIDHAENVVYLSNRLARETTRKKLIASVLNGIKNKQPIRTKARIAFVRTAKDGEKFVELDLAGVGVIGYLFRNEWSTCFTSEISMFAKVGEIIDVEVIDVLAPREYKIGEQTDTTSRKFIFKCSRKNAIDFNPWEGIEDKYPVGSIVSITCVDKSSGKFFAKVDGLDEVNALCVYPDGNNINIRVGGRYEARVKKVNEEKKGFILKPYKEL